MKTEFLKVNKLKEFLEANHKEVLCGKAFIIALDQEIKEVIEKSIKRAKLDNKKVLMAKHV